MAVAAHINPDGDAVGSVLGVAEVLSGAGKNVIVVPPKNVSAKYGFLSGWGLFLKPWESKKSVDLLICLDAGEADRLPKGARELLHAGTPTVNIDHHVSNDGFGTASWINATAPSTTYMVYALFKEGGYEITAAAAEALYVGLMTDTGGFSYTNATAEAFAMAAELVGMGVKPFEVAKNLFGGSELSHYHLSGAILGTMARAGGGDIVYMYANREMLEATGTDPADTEGIIDVTKRVAGMRVGVFFRETEDGDVRVSFRSGDSINVRLLAESLGGGGHNEAAGCKINGPLDGAIRSVLARCEEWLAEEG
ncbi:MAG: bifunctional oligoribonuclease/PAP phosphatase NrnA [Candidatus Coatesbacteria bacterium]|nr:MAG: bifunctional oligoribonuclease/PAP phosphatase NrnA [Candidatus Coatesbacteria bacterium]